MIEEMTPCVIHGFSLSLYSLLVYFLRGMCVSDRAAAFRFLLFQYPETGIS